MKTILAVLAAFASSACTCTCASAFAGYEIQWNSFDMRVLTSDSAPVEGMLVKFSVNVERFDIAIGGWISTSVAYEEQFANARGQLAFEGGERSSFSPWKRPFEKEPDAWGFSTFGFDLRQTPIRVGGYHPKDYPGRDCVVRFYRAEPSLGIHCDYTTQSLSRTEFALVAARGVECRLGVTAAELQKLTQKALDTQCVLDN